MSSKLVAAAFRDRRLLLASSRLSPLSLPSSSRLFSVYNNVRRGPAVESISADEHARQLDAKRLQRPNSPHLTIYQPQLTWISSIANRMTGVGLSVGLYAYAMAYLCVPGLDSATALAFLAGLPFWLKTVVKLPLAAAFSFHTFNGLRHLAWDVGKFLSLKSSYAAGYAVLAATAVSTIGLVLL